MKTCFSLPDGYEQTDYVNLYTDRPRYRKLNFASFLIGAAAIAVGWLWQGFDALLALLFVGFDAYFLWLLILAACVLACLTLHELLHGLFFRLISGLRPRYARKGVLLFTGSEAYFSRRDYVVIILAPAAIFALAFALLSVFLQNEWFWLAIALQAVNLGGSVGDYYKAFRALRQPKNALFWETGVSLTIYTENTDETDTGSGM